VLDGTPPHGLDRILLLDQMDGRPNVGKLTLEGRRSARAIQPPDLVLGT
jgi:hypothetical protein